MDSRESFAGRRLAVRYWNSETRVADRELAKLEQALRGLGELAIKQVKSPEDPAAAEADLLIVAAQTVPEEDFSRWLASLARRMKGAGLVWTPALVMANVPFGRLAEILPEAVQENWYFDIVSPEHLESMPIRVANLLRIHDHLREIERYAKALVALESRVEQLERELEALGGRGS